MLWKNRQGSDNVEDIRDGSGGGGIPIKMAGGGCGTLKPGRHIVYPKETPLNNLWVSMLNRMEVNLDRLGDSTGALSLS